MTVKMGYKRYMVEMTKEETLKMIGERLASRRQELGLTPHRVGIRVGATGAQVSRWEEGGSPNLYFTLRLCHVLGMTPNELLTGKRSKPRPANASSSSEQGLADEGGLSRPEH